MRKIAIVLLIFGIFITNLRFFYNSKLAYGLEEKCTAEAMVTVERNTGRVLYSKNKDKILPMASTTKIITGIVAIENCSNLDEKHLITKDMTGVEGSSIYLKAGERLSIRELLYGLMLRSGNDSAVAIAKIISGSVEDFVKLMNEFCLKLGMNNTNIVTVNGLHDKNHYTTASDLAMVSCYALSNPIFSEIVSTKEATISCDYDLKNQKRILKNKNKLLKTLDGSDGVKTGYTMKAGRCFVGSATRENMQVVCVVLNCREMFEESSRLINKAFQEFSLVDVSSVECVEKCDKNLKSKNIFKKSENPIFLPLKVDEIDKLKTELDLFANPQNDGLVGYQYFLLENELIFSEKIYTILDGKKTKSNDFVKNFNKVIRAF